jgi:hypothetical protein
LSTGSPAGWICPKPVVTAMVVVMLNEAGVRIFNVTATVAIVEIAARSVRASRNKTFMFNFSPPFLFFTPENNI